MIQLIVQVPRGPGDAFRKHVEDAGKQLDALQWVAGVASLPLHQGLTQAVAIHICLTAVSIPNVLCRGEGTEVPL